MIDSVVDSIFAFINFLVVVALLVYAFKSYALVQLKEAIVKEYHDLVNLHDEHRQLSQDQQILEESIVMQEDHAKMLFKKINQWRNTVELEAKADSDEQDHLREDANAKAAKQARQYALKVTYNQVAPLVTHKLERELQEKFSTPDQAHTYISSILKEIR